MQADGSVYAAPTDRDAVIAGSAASARAAATALW